MVLPLNWFRASSATGSARVSRPSNRRRTHKRRLGSEMLEQRCAPAGLANLMADFGADRLGVYGVFGMSGCKMDITNPQTEIGGDVGLGPNAVQNFSDGKIDGDLNIDPTTNNSHSNNVKLTGQVNVFDLTPTNAAALDASSVVAALHTTQTVGAITGSKTINSAAGNNVINVISASNVQLNGSASLTLNGNASDYFFINVTGNFAMTGTSSIKLTGGIQETHVLWNILGSGQQVAFTGKSVGEGTFIAVNRDIAVSGATVEGVLIGGMNHHIAITSGAHVQVNAPHFAAPTFV
jgi:ice-binding like protein